VFVILRTTVSANQEHRVCRRVVDVNPARIARGGRTNSVQRDNNEEIKMRLLKKTAIVLGMAGAMALGSITASQARFRAGPAAAAGFVAGAAVGAVAANANAGNYYGSGGYGYDSGSGYDSYAYEPAYAAPAYTSPNYYGPINNSGYGYNTNNNGPWHERTLQGRDW